MIEWNEQHGIRVMRLSSELFPHKSNPKVKDYTFDFAMEAMRKVGEKAREYGHRLTFHPGQYNVNRWWQSSLCCTSKRIS